MKNKRTLLIKKIVLIGMLAASITGGKLALLSIPNIEIVTLLIIVYTVVFGFSVSLPVTLVFVTVDILLFGLNTWVISYYIYWSGLAIVTSLFHRLLGEKTIIYAIIAAAMSAFFGVLTTFVDTAIAAGASKQFFRIYSIIYMRGIYFYIIHIVSNTIIVSLAFLPLREIMKKLKVRYFGIDGKNI